ncbi:MAG: fibrobacter succinogenes major paralogous domain-containing protein [Lentimicrobiaceae bacterium]|nr:fibrobacter succinogenes major paralogous domain-containing protein [Lentimicrobiaceae bacterium]
MKKLFYLAIFFIVILSSCKKDDDVKTPPVNGEFSVTTADITEVGTTTAVCGGVISGEPGFQIKVIGVCWDTIPEPNLKNMTRDIADNTGKFTSIISGLSSGKKYYVRTFVKGRDSVIYGDTKIMTTARALTKQAEVTLYSITFNGVVNTIYTPATISFEYGDTTKYGHEIAAVPGTIIENGGDVLVKAELTVIPGQSFHYRIKMIDAMGISYGVDMRAAALGGKPKILISEPANIGITNAIINGIANPNLFSTTVKIEYGKTTNYGHEIATVPGTITGNSNVNVTASLAGLEKNTTYHCRIKATNEIGTVFSADKTFMTYEVADVDGNMYHSVTIGNQTWLLENLKVTHYRNGDLIPNITDSTVWSYQTSGAMCWYQNKYGTYGTVYGGLYNWYTIVDLRGVAPDGWHVPTDEEWTALKAYLGGDEKTVGGKLKESGLAHWLLPNTDATNSSGFTALPGGFRGNAETGEFQGCFYGINEGGYFWSATEGPAPFCAWNKFLKYNTSRFYDYQAGSKLAGLSIRCLKD